MPSARLRLALLAVSVLAGVLFMIALAGLWACDPPPLPGDGFWVWRYRFGEALSLLSGAPRACFTGDGQWAISAARWTAPIAAAPLVLWAVFEAVFMPLRRARLRAHGGHLVIASESAEACILAADLGGGSRFFIVRDRAAAIALARRKPFAEIAILKDGNQSRMLSRFGVARAATIALVTDSDLTNAELTEAVVFAGGKGEVLVRLEQASTRAAKGDALRRTGEASGRFVGVAGAAQMQGRQGLALAMPGRFRRDGAMRVHIAIAGSGPLVQELALLVARQGYGLESRPPLLTILRTGRSDFTAGALARLQGVPDVVQCDLVAVDGDDAIAIEQAFAALALSPEPLSALHITGDGSAEALARHFERIALELGVVPPPIVAYGGAATDSGRSGMIRSVRADQPGRMIAAARLADSRARAIHDSYLAGQHAARGEISGSLPAERPWETLAEIYRDDNRNAADHAGYKAALAGMRLEAGGRDDFDAEAIETLAPTEHARWSAARRLNGWSLGARNDAARLHPDLKPYSDLDEDARRKDRELVALLPSLLRTSGEGMRREREFAILTNTIPNPVLTSLLTHSGAPHAAVPIIGVNLDEKAGMAAAHEAQVAGLAVHAFLSAPPTTDGAAILRNAYRITVARPNSCAAALAAAMPVLVGEDGSMDATLLD